MLRKNQYLSVIVEVPQVQMTNSVHTSKQSGVNGRPHDIIHIIRVIFKGVEGFVVLQMQKEM